MLKYSVPYGKTELEFCLPETFSVDIIAPKITPPIQRPQQHVIKALSNPAGAFQWGKFSGAKTAAIAINDKTRPVPHNILLPPLLYKIDELGIPPEHIKLLIATGAHPPQGREEFTSVVPESIIKNYAVISHDCDDKENLKYVGDTKRGTPIWINRAFLQADLKIVLGNIEPHQFQGFSGGAKSAAIGLAGRQTITNNHALMTQAEARLGNYDSNPARQDIEEIGKLIGIDLALNVVMNHKKQIVRAIAGSPPEVMKAGIPNARDIFQIPVNERYGMVIASPGGHPKDINVYQAQKGLAHASMITRPGGVIILAAACPEGAGSKKYEKWISQMNSQEEVIRRFKELGFQLGVHKAYQIARDISDIYFWLISDLSAEQSRKLLLNSSSDIQSTITQAIKKLPPGEHIAILPMANATIPHYKE